MQTHLTSDPSVAAAYVRRGLLAAFPTETVYGLGADAFQPDAIARIFAAKGRPQDNPLIVHLAALGQLRAVARTVPEAARRLIDAFFPGPTTLILPRHEHLPAAVSGGLGTVGVRMPRHPVAHAFLAACGTPVAAPSANRSGRPSPTTWQAVRDDLDGRIACILRGDRSEAGLESTVVDCTGPVPLVLRAGVVTLEALRAVLPETRLAAPGTREAARSPGTRYRHYAPRAAVRLVDHPEDAAAGPTSAYLGLDAPPDPTQYGHVTIAPDLERYAYEVYDFFRRCDALGIDTIYCQRVVPEGLGRALLDRLERAARG
ncbi:MAG: L-threonylcarbamoyladenylate synthase [Rhodothermales bacterium]|nr:L-threonylcarbamoyladenylate synthase [Rhodothermales bacterium]